MEKAKSRTVSPHLVARVCLEGATPLAWRLRYDGALLKTEADFAASQIGNCWIEKLEIDCEPPGSPQTPTDDPVHELGRLIESDVIRSEAYRLEIAELARRLRNTLPLDCQELLWRNEATFNTVLEELIDEGAKDVLAWLRPSPASEVS